MAKLVKAIRNSSVSTIGRCLIHVRVTSLFARIFRPALGNIHFPIYLLGFDHQKHSLNLQLHLLLRLTNA
jgi:hypothetical protein